MVILGIKFIAVLTTLNKIGTTAMVTTGKRHFLVRIGSQRIEIVGLFIITVFFTGDAIG